MPGWRWPPDWPTSVLEQGPASALQPPARAFCPAGISLHGPAGPRAVKVHIPFPSASALQHRPPAAIRSIVWPVPNPPAPTAPRPPSRSGLSHLPISAPGPRRRPRPGAPPADGPWSGQAPPPPPSSRAVPRRTGWPPCSGCCRFVGCGPRSAGLGVRGLRAVVTRQARRRAPRRVRRRVGGPRTAFDDLPHVYLRLRNSTKYIATRAEPDSTTNRGEAAMMIDPGLAGTTSMRGRPATLTMNKTAAPLGP